MSTVLRLWNLRRKAAVTALLAIMATAVPAQAPPGEVARSQSETLALAYMRTVLNAERAYKKKKGQYTGTLAALVNHGSFTRRMARPDRGEYAVSLRGGGKGFALLLVPKEYAFERRSFYMDESGAIRAEEDKPASRESPVVSR